MSKKALSFTKSDVLNAFIELIEDDEMKGEVVESLLMAKIYRLRQEGSYRGVKVTRENISEYSESKIKELTSLDRRIGKIVEQIEEYQGLYDELSESDSFDEANLGGFKSKLKQIFQWDGQ